MEQRIFDFTDAQLTAETARNGTLNLVIGSDGLSLLVTDALGRPMALRIRQFPQAGRSFQETEAEVRRIFGHETLLTHLYGRVRCAFSNQNATLVPRRLFQPDDLAAYFKMLLHAGDYTYGFTSLPAFDCTLVYAVEPAIRRLVGQYFPEAQCTHLAATLLPTFQQHSARNGYEVCLHLRYSSLFISVFDRQNLLFYNAFPFKQPSDVLYSTLLACEQFRLQPLETPLLLTGNLSEDSDIYRLLSRYFRILHFGLLGDAFPLPMSASTLPKHTFFDLYSLQSV